MKQIPLSRWRPQNCLAVVGMLTIGCLSSGPWRQASAEGFGPTQASSSVDLTASPSQSSCGDKVTLDAMVSPAGATGSVEFFDFGTSLGSTPVAADGSAELSVSGLPGGSHSLTATYSGDANYTDSTSPPVGVQVNPLPSSVTLTSDVNPSLCGQKVNLIAHVEPVGATGTVQFVWIVPRQPPATIGYVQVDPQTGDATLSITYLPPGNADLYAHYSGDDCHVPADSPIYTQQVNPSPTSVTLDVQPPKAVCGDKVTLTAQVTPVGASGTVTFNRNGRPIGDATVDPQTGLASFSTTFALSTQSLTAGYSEFGGAPQPGRHPCYDSSESPKVTLEVNPIRTVTTLDAPAKVFCGDKVTVTATVNPPGRSGEVELIDGMIPIATAPLDGNGQAMFSVVLDPGTHNLFGVHQSDPCVTETESQPTQVEVSPLPTETSLTSDANPSKVGGKVILAAHVEPTDATGTVTFVDGTTALGSAPLDANGDATLSVSTLSAGKHDLTASYDGAACRAVSTSATYSQVVEGAPTAHVVYPNGGEVLLVGSDVKLAWTTDGSQPVPTVSLYVSRDNGATYVPIVLDAANTGSFVWTVPPPGTNTDPIPVFSALFKVVAKDVSNLTGDDVSDAPFCLYDADLPTAVIVTQLGAEGGADDITVKWALVNRGVFATVTVERSEVEAGPWSALSAPTTEQGDLTVVVDRTAQSGRTYWYRVVGTTTAGARALFGPVQGARVTPIEFALSAAWPNPTRNGFRTDFAVPRQASVRLSLLDLQGREVLVMADGIYSAGRYQMSWDGRTDHGTMSPGMYFLRLKTPDRKIVQRVVIVP